MNDNYFKKNEEKDYLLLQDLNSYLGLKELGRTTEKNSVDATGITSTGDIVEIELKNRNQELKSNDYGQYYIKGTSNNGRSYTGDTMMIEAHKMASMFCNSVIENTVPLYINFLDDGNTAVVFNLNRLKRHPRKEHKNIQSKGYEKMEIGVRFGLYLSDAYIYKKHLGKWNKERL